MTAEQTSEQWEPLYGPGQSAGFSELVLSSGGRRDWESLARHRAGSGLQEEAARATSQAQRGFWSAGGGRESH